MFLEILERITGRVSSRPVFVIGTGRSGTHWLGYSLGNHPEVRATVEAQPMFGLATSMALNASLEERLFGRLVQAYRWELFKSSPRLYVDKSHPNIWLAEKLKMAFPQALFVGIERNPYATVASMLRHKGVSAWHRRWREFPVPNRFLGITHELAERYDSLPLAAQCAIRWAAHRDRLNELGRILGGDLLRISYETFAHETALTVGTMQKFLGLQQPIPVPEVKMESLDKWRSQLSADDLRHIEDIVGLPPPAESGRQ